MFWVRVLKVENGIGIRSYVIISYEILFLCLIFVKSSCDGEQDRYCYFFRRFFSLVQEIVV